MEARKLATILLYHGAMSVVHVEMRKRNAFGSASSTCRGYREPLGIFGSCVKFSVKNTGKIFTLQILMLRDIICIEHYANLTTYGRELLDL